ncbi:MAG: aldo/keto reductase [Acidimicrobiales bacterium]
MRSTRYRQCCGSLAAGEAAGPVDERTHGVVDGLTATAAERQVTPTALAHTWVMAQPGVRPIVGPSEAAHLDAVAEALTVTLTEGEIQEMSAW